MSNSNKYICTVDYATTTFIGTTNNGYTLENTFPAVVLMVDGVAPIVGDMILVKDQTSSIDNGVYQVTRLNSVVDNVGFELQRVCMGVEKIYTVFVKSGTTQSTTWWCTDLGVVPYTPAVTPQVFTEIPLGGDGTLQDAYDNTTPGVPEIILDPAHGALTIRDSVVPLGSNLLEVQDNGGATTYFSVDATGTTVDGKLTVTGLIDPTGLQCIEQSSNPGVVAPGNGTFWVRDDVPNVPIFTDDVGTDWNLLNVAAGNLQSTYDAGPTGEINLDAGIGKILISDELGGGIGGNIFEVEDTSSNSLFAVSDTKVTSGVNVEITGNLNVMGTLTYIDTTNLSVSDRFIFSAANYDLNPAITAGMVFNCDPDTTAQVMVAAGGFTAGVAAVSNPTVVVNIASGTFSPGDVIVIVGSDSNENDGIYEVDSHAGNLVTIRGVGTVLTTIDFVRNQFTTNAVVAGTITKTNVSVLRSRFDCDFEVTKGSDAASLTTNTAVLIKSISSAGGESIVANGDGPASTLKGLTAGTGIVLTGGINDVTITNTSPASAVTLQNTYDNSGATPIITLDDADGGIIIRDDTGPAVTGNLFAIQNNGGTTTYFSVDATGTTVDGKLTVTGLIDPTGLQCVEQAANPGTVAAGNGTFWVKNDSPNVPVFTDDVGTDYILNTFLSNTDTPAAYVANSILAVNSGSSAVEFSNNLKGTNTDVTGSSVAIGGSSSVGANTSSVAIGASASVTTNSAIAVGSNALTDISETVVVQAMPMVQRTMATGILGGTAWTGSQTCIATPIIDLAPGSVPANTDITLPAGTRLYVDQIDIIKTNVSGAPSAATIDIGTIATPAFFITGLSYGGPANNTIGNRITNSALLGTDGVTTLRVQITSAGGGSPNNIRVVFKGTLIRDE